MEGYGLDVWQEGVLRRLEQKALGLILVHDKCKSW